MSILNHKQKEEFDVNNVEHQQEIIIFLDSGRWNSDITVHGSYNIPYSCLEKMARYAFTCISSKR